MAPNIPIMRSLAFPERDLQRRGIVPQNEGVVLSALQSHLVSFEPGPRARKSCSRKPTGSLAGWRNCEAGGCRACAKGEAVGRRTMVGCNTPLLRGQPNGLVMCSGRHIEVAYAFRHLNLQCLSI